MKNTFWLVLAEAVIKILSLVLIIYMVRVLGVTQYGKFTFAFSFVSIMAIFSDLGVVDFSTRGLARNKNNEERFSGIFTLEALLCVFMLGVSVVGSFFITPDSEIRKIIWILSIFFISNSLFGIIFSFLRARQNMEYEALIRIAQSLANTLVVFFVILYLPSIGNVSYGYLISNLIILFFLLLLFRARFQPIHLHLEKHSLDVLKMSWPMSLGFVASWTYLSINSVMLGYFNLITENGWYNAASRIALVAIIPATLILKTFYPMLSNFYVSSAEKLQKSWDYLAQSMLWLALPMVTGMIVIAPKIIYAFYGPGFSPSILALQLLIIVIGISFITIPYSVILVVADQQKKNFSLIVVGAVMTIGLNVILVPWFGFYGSIISALIASSAVFFGTVAVAHYTTAIRIVNKNLLLATVISAFSSAVMYGLIHNQFMDHAPLVIICFTGALVYCLLSLVLYRISYVRSK